MLIAVGAILVVAHLWAAARAEGLVEAIRSIGLHNAWLPPPEQFSVRIGWYLDVSSGAGWWFTDGHRRIGDPELTRAVIWYRITLIGFFPGLFLLVIGLGMMFDGTSA